MEARGLLHRAMELIEQLKFNLNYGAFDLEPKSFLFCCSVFVLFVFTNVLLP